MKIMIHGLRGRQAPRDELADLVHGNLALNIKIMTLYQRLDELVRETRGLWSTGDTSTPLIDRICRYWI